MKPMILTLFLICLCCISYRAASAENTVFESIFDSTWNILHAFEPSLPQVPRRHCTVANATFRDKIIVDEAAQVYRVPHSRIISNGNSCGSLLQNASEADLYFDKHMLLVPGWLLANETLSKQKQVGAMQRDLFDKLDRHGVARTAFNNFMGYGLEVWVGYEADSDRTCGNVTVLPRTSFSIFTRSDRNLDIGDFLHIPEGPLSPSYSKGELIYMTFDEPFTQRSYKDKVCPFEHPSTRSSHAPKVDPQRPSPSCFPATSYVRMVNGSTKVMSDIVIGDEIMDLNGKSTEVFMFSHFETSNERYVFLTFKTSKGKLTVSPGHYIYTSSGIVSASDVRVDDYLISSDGVPTLVTEKKEVLKRGLINPQTLSGSMIVDGFVVSSYTTAVTPALAHAALAPLRFLSVVCGDSADGKRRAQEALRIFSRLLSFGAEAWRKTSRTSYP